MYVVISQFLRKRLYTKPPASCVAGGSLNFSSVFFFYLIKPCDKEGGKAFIDFYIAVDTVPLHTEKNFVQTTGFNDINIHLRSKLLYDSVLLSVLPSDTVEANHKFFRVSYKI